MNENHIKQFLKREMKIHFELIKVSGDESIRKELDADLPPPD